MFRSILRLTCFAVAASTRDAEFMFYSKNYQNSNVLANERLMERKLTILRSTRKLTLIFPRARRRAPIGWTRMRLDGG